MRPFHFPARVLLCAVACLAFLPRAAAAQEDSLVTITGQAVDSLQPAATFPLLMVVNKATGRGYFGNANGSFSIRARRRDTIIVSVIGYETAYRCFRDSMPRDTYRVTVNLVRLHQDLGQVTVFPERDLEKIEEDIDKLGYDESDYRLTGVDAWSAPLTALYQEFSKKEKDKRRAAELWNDQRRRELIQELLRLYDRNDLIDLSVISIEDFTDFLRIDDAMLKSWSQYEMAVYMKTMYGIYRRRR